MKLVNLFEDVQDPTSKEAEQAASIVAEECSTYLKKIGGALTTPQAHLFRGSSVFNKNSWFEQKTPRSDRRPRDTPTPIHNMLDQWFYQQFGFHYRSAGVFVSKDYGMASGFGTTVYCIFPADPYKLLYSPKMDDLWGQILHKVFNSDRERMRNVDQKGLDQEEQRQISELLESANYREVLSPKQVKKEAEVTIQCQKYYMVYTKHIFAKDPREQSKAKTAQGTFVRHLLDKM